MPPRAEVVLSESEREVLERWARRPKSAQAVAVALAVSGLSASAATATAPSTAHWTAARCTAWKVAALKRDHHKPTAKQIASANKTFVRHGCKIRL